MASSSYALPGSPNRQANLASSGSGETAIHPPPRHRPNSSSFGRIGHEMHAFSDISSASPYSEVQEEVTSIQTPPQIPQRHALRSPEKFSSASRHSERRVSDASVITQVGVSAPTFQDTTVHLGSRHALDDMKPGSRLLAQDTKKDLNPGAFSSRYQEMGRRDNSQGLASNSAAHAEAFLPNDQHFSKGHSRETAWSTRNNTTHPANIQTSIYDTPALEGHGSYDQDSALPVVPMKSPLRTQFAQDAASRAQSRHARNKSSIDRAVHNSSVASSARQTESDTAAANSDVFSQDEAEESSYESDISSLGGDDEASENEIAQKPQSFGQGAQTGLPDGDRQTRNMNQVLPSAPSASAVYDLLAPGAGMDSQFRSVPAPALSPASSVYNSSVHSLELPSDLSRRPPSPVLSDISDADSSDSAVPPPVSMTRDSAGPRYKNAAEQKYGASKNRFDNHAMRLKPSKSGNVSSPDLGLKKSNTWTSMGKTSFAASTDGRSPRSPRSPWDSHFRSGSATPSRSRAASRADSLPTTAFASGHLSSRSKSLSVVQPSTHTKTFNVSLPSLSGIFGGMSFRSKAKKEPATLPALRKITFDSRGKKQVLDLNMSADQDLDANEIAERDLFGDNALQHAALTGSTQARQKSFDGRRSVSGQGAHNHPNVSGDGQVSQQGWRNREKGAPRRTAWK